MALTRRGLGGGLSARIDTVHSPNTTAAPPNAVFTRPPPARSAKAPPTLSTAKQQVVFSPTMPAVSLLPPPPPSISFRAAPELRVAQQVFRPVPFAPAGILGAGQSPMNVNIDQVSTGQGSGRTMIPAPKGVDRFTAGGFRQQEAKVPEMQVRPKWGLPKVGPSKAPAAPLYEAGDPLAPTIIDVQAVTPQDMKPPDPGSAPSITIGGGVQSQGISPSTQPPKATKPEGGTKPVKKGMSTGTKVLIALLVAGGVAAAASRGGR